MSVRRDAAESMRLRALDIIDARIAACIAEAERQTAIGNALGAATERSAKFEAQLLTNRIRELPTLSRQKP